MVLVNCLVNALGRVSLSFLSFASCVFACSLPSLVVVILPFLGLGWLFFILFLFWRGEGRDRRERCTAKVREGRKGNGERCEVRGRVNAEEGSTARGGKGETATGVRRGKDRGE